MVLYRLRIMVEGYLAGVWGKFGGFGAQGYLPTNHFKACIGNNAEVMVRLAEEEGGLPSHMARSRTEPSEVASIISDPGRDRRLRVADEQRRFCHLRTTQAGSSKEPRGGNPSHSQASSKDGPRDHASRNTRWRRYEEERSFEPRTAPKSPPKK